MSGESDAGQAGDGSAAPGHAAGIRRTFALIEGDLIDEARLLANEASAGRTCGDCPVCCILPEIAALAKPPREVCVHLIEGRCGRYDTRPEACRAFHCLWLRGALRSGDIALRPANLGVLLDAYISSPSQELRIVATEVWAEALEQDEARAIVAALAELGTVTVYYRDGRCSELTSECTSPGESAANPVKAASGSVTPRNS